MTDSIPVDPFLRWGDVVVPWTAAWSSEAPRDRSFIRTERIGGMSLRFLCDGIDTPGVGKPMFKVLHNERCRDVIRRRVCQICRGPLGGDRVAMNMGEREGLYPLINDGLPMCRGCAELALAQCPGLQKAAQTGWLRMWHAIDWIFAPVVLGPVPPENGGNPHVNALLAKECEPVFSGVKLVLTRFRSLHVPGDLSP